MKTNVFFIILFALFVFGFSFVKDFSQVFHLVDFNNADVEIKEEELEKEEGTIQKKKQEQKLEDASQASALEEKTPEKIPEKNTFFPFKNALFQYPLVHEESFSGDFLVVDYSMQRDLMERDEIPEDKVKDEYINFLTEFEQEKILKGTRYLQMQSTHINASQKTPLLLYIHGGGGDRTQGFNDVSFGGNFNRVKNLLFVNNGIYISPDIYDFHQKGLNAVREIIAKKQSEFPLLEVYVACGSSGGNICWGLANHKESEHWLKGILLLGSMTNKEYFEKNLWKNIPIYMGHGTKDPLMSYENTIDFFTRIKNKNPAYPIKIHIFTAGTHGTPIRMTDWYEILSGMYSYEQSK